jgi:hypothetical protein
VATKLAEMTTAFQRKLVLICLVFALVLRASELHAVEMQHINAPVIVRESPENEAVVVKLSDGKLRIFYTLQPAGTELRSITSSDSGLTWEDDRLEVKMPGKAVFCMQALVDRNGEQHAFVLVRRGEGRTYGVDLFLDVWHWKTSGGRKEWSEGNRIYGGVVGALRGVTQLDSGRILLPVGMWQTGRKAGLPTGAHEVSSTYSDDDGVTWQLSKSRLVAPCYEGFNGSNYGACEPNVLDLGVGRIWMLMRAQTGRMYESYSTDEGTTWSDAVPSKFISSDSPAEMMRLADGRLLVFWNHHSAPPLHEGKFVAGGRDALHAAISDDAGQSWRGFRELYRDPLRNQSPPRRGDRGAAYSAAVQNSQGKVVITTGQGEDRRAILLFDPNWLLETHHEDDFSMALDGWSTFTEFGDAELPVFRDRMAGPNLIDHPDRGDAKALHICRTDNKPGDGAIWNFPAAAQGNFTVRLKLQEGFGGANISFCDRFFNPSDGEGEREAIFGVPIDSSGKLLNHPALRINDWQALEFEWNLDRKECQVAVDGKNILALPILRNSEPGVSYFRIRSTAADTDAEGLLIENVSMDRED